MELDEHLFRRESGRIVAALTRLFGVRNLALAEDVAQDAFCRALEIWTLRGVPDNPAAWLMATAKNRAIDVLRRERTARTFAPELSRLLDESGVAKPDLDIVFAAPAIRDEQLRMMFSCCHPALPEEVQVALILNILCGFGAAEIAGAFLVSRAAVEKRLARGKKALASAQLFDLDDGQFTARLSVVRNALYLLFNEGYHGASARAPVRAELCGEAMRLATMLLEYEPAAAAETDALAALMFLNAAKLPARLDADGHLNPLEHHDRTKWDAALMARGLTLFERSARGDTVSAFHVEAAIAAAHAAAATLDATDWDLIVSLYDRLIAISPTPVVALSRALAIAERDGPGAGLDAIAAIDAPNHFRSYPFYPASLGEMHLRLGHRDDARRHFAAALTLARNDAERRFLQNRIAAAEDVRTAPVHPSIDQTARTPRN